MLCVLAAAVIATIPDAWLVGYAIFGTVHSTVMTIAAWRLAAGQRKYEGMESRVQILADKLVADKVQGLTDAMTKLETRLKETESAMGKLGDTDHKLDTAILKGLAEIKLHVVERAVSKEDLRQHQQGADQRHDRLAEHLSQQDRELAAIKQQLAARPGGRGV